MLHAQTHLYLYTYPNHLMENGRGCIATRGEGAWLGVALVLDKCPCRFTCTANAGDGTGSVFLSLHAHAWPVLLGSNVYPTAGSACSLTCRSNLWEGG